MGARIVRAAALDAVLEASIMYVLCVVLCFVVWVSYYEERDEYDVYKGRKQRRSNPIDM